MRTFYSVVIRIKTPSKRCCIKSLPGPEDFESLNCTKQCNLLHCFGLQIGVLLIIAPSSPLTTVNKHKLSIWSKTECWHDQQQNAYLLLIKWTTCTCTLCSLSHDTSLQSVLSNNQTLLQKRKQIPLLSSVNFLTIRTPRKFVVITLKFELCGSIIE